MATAILVDGAFFLRRFKHSFPDDDRNDPKSVANALGILAYWHLSHRIDPDQVEKTRASKLQLAEMTDFYRLFFYDCTPLLKRMHRPISGRSVDFGKTAEAVFRVALHEELRGLRKAALRLGRLNDTSRWRVSEDATARFIKNAAGFHPEDDDFEIDTKQKGVDMRLGLDVAALAFKKQVDQIVLVAGDADFVPAAKLARREGIDVVLDRMGDKRAARDLIDHVDGVRDSYFPAPKNPKI